MKLIKPVSVIIPSYNRTAFLKRAILSVLHQDNFLGEIIIIDDGSTDSTGKDVAKLASSLPVIYKYIKNSGPATARNIGVALAQYSFIAFLDSDDHWCKKKLNKQLSLMNDFPEFCISHTGETWLRRGEHLNQKNIHKPRHGYIFDHCLQLCAVGMSTVIMQKKLFEEMGGFDASLPCCEDYDFWIRISKKHPFLLVPEPLTIKEGGRDDQVSYMYRIGMDKFRIYAIEKLLSDKSLTSEQRKKALETLQRKCAVYGNGCIKHGKTEEGNTFLAIPKKYIQ